MKLATAIATMTLFGAFACTTVVVPAGPSANADAGPSPGAGATVGAECEAYLDCCKELASSAPQLGASCDTWKKQLDDAQTRGASTASFEAACKSARQAASSAGYCTSSGSSSASSGSSSASSGSSSGSSGSSGTTAPTWSSIHAAYLAPGTVGNCAKGGCHSAMSSAAGSYTWLAGKGYIRATNAPLADPAQSCLSWLGGNMPPSGPSSNAAASAALSAWAAAGAPNN